MNRDRRTGGGRLAALACLVAMGMACAEDEAGRAGLPGNDEGFDDDGGVGGKADETGPGAFSVVRRVAVINFNPSYLENAKDEHFKSAAQLANEYIHVVAQASHGALEYRLASLDDATFAGGWAELDRTPPNVDGVAPDEVQWGSCRAYAAGCADMKDEVAKGECNESSPCGRMGYERIIGDLGLCNSIETHAVDEVWIFGVTGYPHAWEATMVGPSGYDINGGPAKVDCLTRNVPVMFFNRERTVAQMLHNLGHRAERTLTHVYGATEGRFAEFALPATFSSTGGEPEARRCGSVHAPPNSTPAEEYDYDNTDAMLSECIAFYQHYPDVQDLPPEERVDVSAATWGGEGLGQSAELPYLIWWFQHFPQVAGKDVDGHFNNWWRHVTLFDQFHDGTAAQPGSCWEHAADQCPAECEVRCNTCLPPGAALECGGGGRQDLAAECAALPLETCDSLGYCSLASCYGAPSVCALDGTGLQPCASPCDDPRRTVREYCEYPRTVVEPNRELGCYWASVQHFEEDGDGEVDRSASFCRNAEDIVDPNLAAVTEQLFGVDPLAPGCFEFEFSQGRERSQWQTPPQQIGCSNLDFLLENTVDTSVMTGLAIGSKCTYVEGAVPPVFCQEQ